MALTWDELEEVSIEDIRSNPRMWLGGEGYPSVRTDTTLYRVYLEMYKRRTHYYVTVGREKQWVRFELAIPDDTSRVFHHRRLWMSSDVAL